MSEKRKYKRLQELKISGIPPRHDTGGRGRKQTASLAEPRKTNGDYRRPMQSERPQKTVQTESWGLTFGEESGTIATINGTQ